MEGIFKTNNKRCGVDSLIGGKIISENYPITNRIYEIYKCSPLFTFCDKINKEKQIKFIKQVCYEIISNFIEFRLHPLLFFQLIIQYNDLELVEQTYHQLKEFFFPNGSNITLPPVPNCIINGLKEKERLTLEFELELFNPLFIFKHVKSIEVFEFLYDKFKNISMNFDSKIKWVKIKKLYCNYNHIMFDQPLEPIENKNRNNNKIKSIIKENHVPTYDYYIYLSGTNVNKTSNLMSFSFKKDAYNSENYFDYLKYLIKNVSKVKDCNISEILENYQKFWYQDKLYIFLLWINEKLKKLSSKYNTTKFLKNCTNFLRYPNLFHYLVSTHNNDNDSLISQILEPHKTLNQFFIHQKKESKLLTALIENSDFNVLNLIMNIYFDGSGNLKSLDYQNAPLIQYVSFIMSFMDSNYSYFKTIKYLFEIHNFSFIKSLDSYYLSSVHHFITHLKNENNYECLNYLLVNKLIRNRD